MSPVEGRSAESAPLGVARKEEKAVGDEIHSNISMEQNLKCSHSIGFQSSWSQALILRH